jgi:hypothetical protein
MLVTRQIPALWNGVSQQPDPVRLPSQCAEQVNCWSSVIDGVSKRNPSEFLALMPNGSVNSGAAMHIINRDTSERYIVVVDALRIRVFDMTGQEKTVNAPLGWGYLSLDFGIRAAQGYTLMTVADYTFVLNKTKRVGLLPVGADHDPPTGDYWWLNRKPKPVSQMASIQSPVLSGEGGNGGGTPLRIVSNPTPADPTANPTGHLKGTKQTLQDLPTSGNANGDVWQIVGTNEDAFGTYYVIYENGGWYECVKPGLQNMIDPLTMPHALIRNGDGTFTFGPFAWEPRHVGDDNTNPHPSFVNRKIRDVFFHKNRLGFAVDEGVVMSRAGAFGTFHRLTVTDYLQDEVIDIAASETQVTKIEYAVPFGASMMLFSDQTQFQLTHKDVLAGGTVSLDVTTRYPTVPGVRPAPAGSDVYFASHASGWGKLREYYVNTDGISLDAADVSAHAAQYIPYGIISVQAAPEFDAVFVLTSGARNRVYVYKYFWQTETEKAQSAWHYWEFEPLAEVRACVQLGGYLYLLVHHYRDDTSGFAYVSLERIALFKVDAPFTVIDGDPETGYQVHLDRRWLYDKISGGIQTADSDYYDVTLPYWVPESDRGRFRVVKASSGEPVQITEWLSTQKFRTKTKPDRWFCGLAYESRYTFSKQFMLNGRGEAVLSGRLQLKTFSVYFTDTGYFRAEIKPYGENSQTVMVREYPANLGSVIGSGAIGAPSFQDGKATFAVQANAREAEISLVNDSYLGFTFHSAEWEGSYFNRAR